MSTAGFRHPRYFINRELSWLEFNARVLEEAEDRGNPLLERLKFASIFSTNLDEFFMIRVANLRELELAGVDDAPADGLTPQEQLAAISRRTHELVRRRQSCLREILPALAEHGIRVLKPEHLDHDRQGALERRFHAEIYPVLTPLTVDPSHPFPHLRNQSLNLVVAFDAPETADDDDPPFALVEIPAVLDPLVELESRPSGVDYIQLGEIVRYHVRSLFPGLSIRGSWLFRVTRNSDLALEEEESENILQDLERELRQRTFRRAVRLEVEADMPPELSRVLARGLEVMGRETYHIDGIIHPPSLMRIYKLERFRHLKDPPFNPRLSPRLAAQGSIFSILRERDLLLHHPYEAFSTVVELLRDAAHDPKVLAIKLTLYRTSGDSAIIDALKEAAENGKQVTAVVELKARFDERNNIVWARELERAGCHVVYGIVGLKTHCKAALIVRRENHRVVRYVHLSTGNYNSTTARLYTDTALLTHDAEIGEDVSLLFNVLTGYNAQNVRDVVEGRKPAPTMRKLAVSPFNMRERLIQLIEDEARLHSPQRPGLIQAKFNSLVDPSVIEALYRASTAGVTIRLQVRGICCLRPGIPGVSENIAVTSVVDRFLEHSRIFHFRHGGDDLVYLSSADWMPRNLYRRVEVMFPIEDPINKARCIDEILATSLGDNVKARRLLPDGRYVRVEPGDKPVLRSQSRLMEVARAAGIKQAPEVEEPAATIEPERHGKRRKRSRRTEIA